MGVAKKALVHFDTFQFLYCAKLRPNYIMELFQAFTDDWSASVDGYYRKSFHVSLLCQS